MTPLLDKEILHQTMQITAFRAILAQRINIKGCEEIMKILSRKWSLIARSYFSLIIHQFKTKKTISAKKVWMPGLN